MLIAQRRSKLGELIARRGMSDLDSLAQELGVSHSTVRRDVELLATRGLVQRTHGGVIWTGASSDIARPYAFDQRLEYESNAKRRVAVAARGLVEPRDTVLIDGEFVLRERKLLTIDERETVATARSEAKALRAAAALK